MHEFRSTISGNLNYYPQTITVLFPSYPSNGYFHRSKSFSYRIPLRSFWYLMDIFCGLIPLHLEYSHLFFCLLQHCCVDSLIIFPLDLKPKLFLCWYIDLIKFRINKFTFVRENIWWKSGDKYWKKRGIRFKATTESPI